MEEHTQAGRGTAMERAFIVAGLAYGDEGKGATVDFLVRKYQAGLVIRYNGGAQAGHNVVLPDGRHHEFKQFGSGTFVSGVRTHLSRFMMVNPIAMLHEEAHLREVGVTDAFERTTVDSGALITTPFQIAVNRIEQHVTGARNSCGVGIGQTREDYAKYGNAVLFACDFWKGGWNVKSRLRFLQQSCRAKVATSIPGWHHYGEADVLTDEAAIDWTWEQYERWYSKIGGGLGIVGYTQTKKEMKQSETIVFEGAQGVLLDETLGEEGFNTWTNTTFANAFNILEEYEVKHTPVRLGVLRTYLTRHGAGPLTTEHPSFRVAKEQHNPDHGFQGAFRVGSFSTSTLDKALKICGGVDCVAINHCDIASTAAMFIIDYLRQKGIKVFISGWGPLHTSREVYPVVLQKEKAVAL